MTLQCKVDSGKSSVETPSDTGHLLAGIRVDIQNALRLVDEADACFRRARTVEDRDQAELLRYRAEGEARAACEAVAGTFILMLRFAVEHQPDLVRKYITEA